MSTLKNAKYVDPAEIYKYLVFDKGLSHYHAIGMINNIKYESSFNAAAIGDNGSSIGLFQHNTNRMNALKKFAGDDWTDWKKQIDYTLTEKDTEKYLQQKFDSPENASVWFTTNWERPANKEQKARTRAMTAGTYHNRFEGIDRWSRKPDDPFYGFDPQAKSFTVRDQWGRPPGDQWYGFDPNTNTWTRGSKAPKKTTTPAKGNNTSSNNTGWEEQTDNYWNNQTASYEEQDEETQEKQIEELLAEEVEKIEIIEEELALSPEMQILERKKQFLQEYSPEELEDTHIYAYEEQQSLPPPQNTPFQLDPSMLQASMPSLPKLFITDLEELEQNTFQYGGVFQDGGKMTKEEFEKRKAAYEKLTGRKLEPPKTFKPSEKARQQYQEKYNQQPVVQSQPSETVQQSRGMTADEVEQLKIQNAPLDPRINQFSFEADNRSEEQRQRDQEAASQLTDPTGWNQVANYLQAPLFQAGNFWNTISGGDDWEKAQQAYNLKQMNPYEQDKWQNFISTAGSNTAQGLMTGMEILDGYAIARALPGFGRQNISTKLLQKEGVDFNLPIKPLNSPKSYESFYTPWSNPNIKDLNKILDEIKDANTWQKEWYNHPHRTSILDKAERTFQREIEAGNKSLISEYKGENPFTKMKKRIERENYKAIGVSSKSPLVEDLFLNKQTLPGTTPFGVSGYRPKMGGERQNIVFVDVASPTRARSTAVHEGNHGLTDANTLIPKYYQEDMVKIFGKNTQVPLRTEKGFASYDDYLKNPTEIYARVAEMRQVFKIKPDRIISEEDAVKMLNHIKAKKTPLPPEFAKAVKDPKKLAQVMNYLPAIGVVIGTTTQFRDGGTFSEDNPRNAMIKARLAYEYQRGNPAVMRMMSGHDNPYQFEEGSTGTHYMASMDNYAVPLIQDENGNLVLGDYGPDSKEAIQFDSPEDAEYFAENYKYFAPALQNFQNGGTVSELYTQKTGLPWATAKEQGLTDGSYEANMQLRNKLLQENPQLQNYKPNNNQTPYQSTVRGMVAQGKTLDDLVSSKVGTREGLTNMFPDLFSGQQPTNTKPNPTTPPTQTQQPTEEVLYYKDRPGAKYVKRADGWYINLGDKTKNDFVRIDDPTGARTKELDKNATKELPQVRPTGNKVKLKKREQQTESIVTRMFDKARTLSKQQPTDKIQNPFDMVREVFEESLKPLKSADWGVDSAKEIIRLSEKVGRPQRLPQGPPSTKLKITDNFNQDAYIGFLREIGLPPEVQRSTWDKTVSWLDEKAQQAKRFLEKEGVIETSEEKFRPDKPTKEQRIENMRNRRQDTPQGFVRIGAIKDSYDPNNTLLSYSNEWDNNEGFVYYATPVKKDRKSTDRYENVEGVAHFLLDASADFRKPYSHEYNKKFIEQAKKNNDWLPVFKDEGNGYVRLQYKKPKDIQKEDKVISPLRQFSFEDIDFSSQKTARGFKKGVNAVTTKEGKDTYLLFKDRDGYSRFSGGSVVFIWTDANGKTRVKDFAGTINQIKQQGEEITSRFKLKPGQLTLGYHDVGSFSAKPAANEQGVVTAQQWAGYNDKDWTGGALLIPKQ